MTKLVISPESASYSISDTDEVVAVELRGGKPRIRRDVVGSWPVVNVSWVTDAAGFEYLRAFYRGETESGSLPFTIDLFLDNQDLTDHNAVFVPSSLSMSGRNGNVFNLSAQLRVEPVATETELKAIVTAYNLANG